MNSLVSSISTFSLQLRMDQFCNNLFQITRLFNFITFSISDSWNDG